VALVIGAAAAVGGYALIDDQGITQATGKVVFVETPGPGQGVRGIDDTAKAATVASTPKVAPFLTHGGPPTGNAEDSNRAYAHGPGPPLLHR
jgi:hypothetical protein